MCALVNTSCRLAGMVWWWVPAMLTEPHGHWHVVPGWAPSDRPQPELTNQREGGGPKAWLLSRWWWNWGPMHARQAPSKWGTPPIAEAYFPPECGQHTKQVWHVPGCCRHSLEGGHITGISSKTPRLWPSVLGLSFTKFTPEAKTLGVNFMGVDIRGLFFKRNEMEAKYRETTWISTGEPWVNFKILSFYDWKKKLMANI